MSVSDDIAITLQDRLVHGALSVEEVARLAGLSKAVIRSDIREGKLPIVRRRRRILISGKVAQHYLAGEKCEAAP